MEIRESEFMYNLGNKLRAIRVKKQISIEFLSEKSKISENILLQIEAGKKTLSLPDFLEISKALGENPGSFFD